MSGCIGGSLRPFLYALCISIQSFLMKQKNTTAYLVSSLKELGITAAHHPAFDVDENVLFNGTGIYVQFALDYLNA